MYMLGKFHQEIKNFPTALRWFTQAAEQGNQHTQYFLDHMKDAPSIFASATRLLHHMGRIFQELGIALK